MCMVGMGISSDPGFPSMLTCFHRWNPSHYQVSPGGPQTLPNGEAVSGLSLPAFTSPHTQQRLDLHLATIPQIFSVPPPTAVKQSRHPLTPEPSLAPYCTREEA